MLQLKKGNRQFTAEMDFSVTGFEPEIVKTVQRDLLSEQNNPKNPLQEVIISMSDWINHRFCSFLINATLNSEFSHPGMSVWLEHTLAVQLS